MKKEGTKILKAKLWKVFSEYIRRRDEGVCISCGKVDEWQNTDAGHYVAKTKGLSIYFHEKNVHAQCTGCNRFRHGNLDAYAIALRRKYGEGILEELNEERQKTRKISAVEYKQLIEEYKAELWLLKN